MKNKGGKDKDEKDMGRKANRLAGEKSPYLLQHAYNPVDWHPWGKEAFDQAVKDDKPVFLSIGYSTCHWCHVMAHESFEDYEVARLMNEAFVSIKVDREERPDIDQIYMNVCQMMTGRGGWPLTIIMTPDKRPFFAATYIPRESRFGAIGLLELIPRITELWKADRGQILESAKKALDDLKRSSASGPGRELDSLTLDQAYYDLSGSFDPVNGGFGIAPKFPTPQNVFFLLRTWKRKGDDSALEMAKATLQAMAMGGIQDQIGFGFHRYSTDPGWSVPHFEKMLYDQALLALAYCEAYQATGKDEYAKVCSQILEYVLRDMTSPKGGFYSAEDADSEGVEGKFYLWTFEEIRNLLGADDFRLFTRVFEVSEEGNFEGRKNILRMRSTLFDAAEVLRIPQDELRKRMECMRLRLFQERERRVHPGKDDKILTDWNGLMIAAFSRAAGVLDEPKYLRAATASADFILREMRGADGRLLHRYRGAPGILANIDDYAFMIWGLIEIYQAGFDPKYLKAALDLNSDLIAHFWDERGGFFFTPDDGEALLVRKKEVYDGAVPSGNSVSMLNLLRLSQITGDPDLEKMAGEIARAFSERVMKMPSAHAMLMTALDYAIGPSYELAIVGDPNAPDTADMLKVIRSGFIPNAVMILVPPDDTGIRKIAAFTKDLTPIKGKATAYVCRGQRCELPTTDKSEVLSKITYK